MRTLDVGTVVETATEDSWLDLEMDDSLVWLDMISDETAEVEPTEAWEEDMIEDSITDTALVETSEVIADVDSCEETSKDSVTTADEDAVCVDSSEDRATDTEGEETRDDVSEADVKLM